MKNKIMKGASILTAVLMFSMVFTPFVAAAPPQPHERWGRARDSGGALIDSPGEYITAWVDGVQYGAAQLVSGGWYDVNGAADHTDTPNLKEGGEGDDGITGDDIYWVHSTSVPALTTGGTFFAETDIFDSGYLYIIGGGEDLNEVAAMPALLKINNVSVVSGIAEAASYVIIYNPTGGAVNANNFVLEANGASVNCGGNIIGGLDDWNVANIPAGGYLAVDVGGPGLSLTNADAITLRGTGASHFIVDRVEYGAIPTIPEETTMNNGPTTTDTNEIARNVGADTNDCTADFAAKGAWLPVSTGTPTSWFLNNGLNYVTVSSEMTAAWGSAAGVGSGNMMDDLIASINLDYGDNLVMGDFLLTRITGGAQETMQDFGIWFPTWDLVEGEGYILEVLNNALDNQPSEFELPGIGIPNPVQININNGLNYIGIPATTANWFNTGGAGTGSGDFADALIASINLVYGDNLVMSDFLLTRITGGAQETMQDFGIWFPTWDLVPGEMYILEVLNNALDNQPSAFTPP